MYCVLQTKPVIKGFKSFSSRELKAQVSFTDHLFSVVYPSVRLSSCPSARPFVCKLFTFSSSSSLGPLSQFQPNLAQNILWRKWLKFVQIKRPHRFPREDKKDKTKCIDKKIYISRTTGPISTILGEGNSRFYI